MAKQTEKWLDGIFRSLPEQAKRYLALGSRELPLVVVAILDLALTELLERRLLADDAEVSSFLGTNGDGRAPAASVGAKIQLAYLTGILKKEDAKVLRILKNIRNLFAHSVDLTYLSPTVAKELKTLDRAWMASMGKSGSLFPEIGERDDIARILVMAVGLSFEIRFQETIAHLPRLQAEAS